MKAQPDKLPAEARLLRPDQLDENLSGGPALQRLAEITHLPTGIASGQVETVDVPAGGGVIPRMTPDADILLHVVAGRVCVKWGSDMAVELPAGPGDTVLVPAGTPYRADNASPSAALQFIIVRGG